MRHLAPLCLLFLSTCGNGATATASFSIPFSLTKAGCTSLPTSPAIQAKLEIEGIATPCTLSLQSLTNGDFATRGECVAVPIGTARTLTLKWYVVSPVGNEILLAEAVGRADLVNPEGSVVEVIFDPTKPALRPKTKGLATETVEEKNKFNCDRTGTSVCDKKDANGMPLEQPKTMDPDQDTCSNLEELCNNTLFTEAVHTCMN